MDGPLTTGARPEIDRFRKLRSEFDHAQIEERTEKTPSLYCGLGIKKRNASFAIAQDEYRNSILQAQLIEPFPPHDTPIDAEKIKRRMRKFAGCVIWLRRTRIDLPFIGTLIIATLTESLNNAAKLVSVFQACQKRYELPWSRDVTLWFHPMPLGAHDRPLQLLVFTDDGYNLLPRSSSKECYYVCHGKPVRRDGAITCASHPIRWAARKIKRCFRSSIAAEAVALATELDNAMWLQSVYYELWNEKFLYTPSMLYAQCR